MKCFLTIDPFQFAPKLTIEEVGNFAQSVKGTLFRVFGCGGGVVPHALFMLSESSKLLILGIGIDCLCSSGQAPKLLRDAMTYRSYLWNNVSYEGSLMVRWLLIELLMPIERRLIASTWGMPTICFFSGCWSPSVTQVLWSKYTP